ncbi:MAG: transcription antitermination factor NusB [Candidatus Omnitrophota bacterium]
MRKRSQSRELALQILYQIDITQDPAAQVLDSFWFNYDDKDVEESVKIFTCQLVKGVEDNLKVIDTKIANCAKNWELERMAVVDRNILRLGVFEIIFCGDIPSKVSINEAVELAKKYSDIQAGKFVNGILDKIKSEHVK